MRGINDKIMSMEAAEPLLEGLRHHFSIFKREERDLAMQEVGHRKIFGCGYNSKEMGKLWLLLP
jgi:hypothetical protein